MAEITKLTVDEQKLAELGYKQELHRSWSGFQNFAISFSIISILAGCFTTFGAAWNNGGPVAISWGWPILSIFILIIGFCMSELVSAYPTSAGIYWWANKLGGARASFYTGWLNLIGLLGIIASVVYGAGSFLNITLSLFSDTYAADFLGGDYLHQQFFWFMVIMVLVTVLNLFRTSILGVINNISVWWHVIGAAIVVVILVFGPSTHQSASLRLHRALQQLRFRRRRRPASRSGSTCFPSASCSRSTRSPATTPRPTCRRRRSRGRRRGQGHLAVDLLLRHRRLDPAARIPVRRPTTRRHQRGRAQLRRLHRHRHLRDRTDAGDVQDHHDHLDDRPDLLLHVVPDLDVAHDVRLQPRRRGARSRLWARVNRHRVPVNAVARVGRDRASSSRCPRSTRHRTARPSRFYAVVSIGVIGLYVAFAIPIYLRWRAGDSFVPGPWTLGNKYKWMAPIAVIEIIIAAIYFIMPGFPAAVPGNADFTWTAVNYTPLVVGGVLVGITIWWFVSAKNWFTGPKRTVDLPPGVSSADEMALEHEHHGYLTGEHDKP